jgi:putative heme-binding domain-containing protein
VAGDREAGERIFFAESNCSQCHMIQGKGGLFGPDLSRVGTSRSVDSLVESIREPEKIIPDRYKTVTVVTTDGKRITGLRNNEDTFSIQLMSADEKLHLFLKRDLGEVIHEPYSLMPAYGLEMLNEKELEDLVAYLDGLRGK